MRSNFQSFRQGFQRFIDSGPFRALFRRMQKACPELAAFRTPADLVAHQHQECLVTPEAKDRVLYALIRLYQQDASLRHAAEALLFVCLAPALSNVHLQTKHLFPTAADSAAEIRLEFGAQVARWNPAKRDRVAVNLWMNVRREIFRRNDREKKEKSAIDQATTAAGPLCGETTEMPTVGHLWTLAQDGQSPYDPEDLELRRGIAWLAETCGFSAQQATLVFARYLCRLSWDEIARRLGMNAETARKRARELARIVRATPGVEDSCPGFEDFMCIPQVEGNEPGALH
jgi:hypothetical protein